MNKAGFSFDSTRRRFLAGTLGAAGSAVCAQPKYAPRIVCNTFYWVQLFSTPFRYITSKPDPLKGPPPPPTGPAPGGFSWHFPALLGNGQLTASDEHENPLHQSAHLCLDAPKKFLAH